MTHPQYPPRPGHPGQAPYPPRPGKRKTPVWVWIVAAFGGFVLLGLIGSALGGTGSETSDRAASTSTPSARPSTAPAPATSGSPTPTTVAAAPEPRTPAPAPSATTPPPAAAAVASAQMPNVVCMNLQDAQDTIQAAGVFYSRSTDATGAGRRQVIDSNWIVIAQTPSPGSAFGEGEAVLSVVKLDERHPC